MVKNNLKDVTFLIPVRVENTDAVNKLSAVLKYLLHSFDTNIIVLEADSEEKIKVQSPIQKVFVLDYSFLLHRTKYLNFLIQQTTTPIIALWEPDVIVPPEQIIESVEVLRKKKADVISPYDGKCYIPSHNLLNSFMKNTSVQLFVDNIEKQELLENDSVNGAMLVDRKKYLDSGLENEKVIGEEFEYFERIKRWEILNYRIFRIDGPLFRLGHVKRNEYYLPEEIRKLNVEELHKISGMTNCEMKEYAEKYINAKTELNKLNFDTVLIITYGRSGSTLLQGILNSIKGCLIRGENFNFCYNLFKAYQSLVNSKRHSGYSPTNPFYGCNLLNTQHFLQMARKTVEFQLLGDEFVRDKVICNGFKEIRYVNLDNDFDEYLDFLKLIFPNVAFIFNTRKHEDVAKSAWWADKDFEEVKEMLTRFERRSRTYMQNKSNCFHITYEDIIHKTSKLNSLFEFLGAKYDEGEVDHVLSRPHSYNVRQKLIKEKTD